MVAKILIEIKARAVDKSFTYLVPEKMQSKIKVGARVYVPFGRQKLEGFVLEILNELNSEYDLKEIIDLIDDEPVINSEMLMLGDHISKKTLSTKISAYQAMLPSALKAKKDFMVPKKYDIYLLLLKKEAKNEKQERIISLFNNKSEILKKEANDISTSSVNTMIKNGILKEIKKEVYRQSNIYHKEYNKVTLSNQQDTVKNRILNSINKFEPFLLHGITGSGKTEVYMSVIEEVIKKGKQVIVLVPEISLTPQLLAKFTSRFGSEIASLHSKLSNGEKYDEWRKIIRGEVKIVIGARSAIFAPFENLGLIIIDEEHSTTYKQESSPKYHAIDVALWRAKKHKIPILLGSATPSIESYTRAKLKIYTLLELNERVTGEMPLINLVDMKKEIRKGNRILSELLQVKIKEALNDKKQVIILLNRRGYTTISSCADCGFTDKCPNCDIPLTYHKKTNSMKCHYCDYSKGKLYKCPTCNSDKINSLGLGTEKLEEYLNEMFEDARIVRMDADTTSKKNAHSTIIEDFENNKYDILIGTQMVAKGLDFKDVTVVGIINGDATLNIPDFRSAERTFELLTQASGRSGRNNKAGEVIIQTFNDTHYSLVKVKNADYKGFYNEEISIRKKLDYPPFCNLTLIKVLSKNEQTMKEEAFKIAEYLKNNLPKGVKTLGPSAMNMYKHKNIYSMQIILKYHKKSDVDAALNYIIDISSGKNNVAVEIDVYPYKI